MAGKVETFGRPRSKNGPGSNWERKAWINLLGHRTAGLWRAWRAVPGLREVVGKRGKGRDTGRDARIWGGGFLAPASLGRDPNVGPRSWVGRDLGDIESGRSVPLRELGDLLLAWNLGYRVVACGRNVLLGCLWWVFLRFAMLGEMPIHFFMGPLAAPPICILA